MSQSREPLPAPSHLRRGLSPLHQPPVPRRAPCPASNSQPERSRAEPSQDEALDDELANELTDDSEAAEDDGEDLPITTEPWRMRGFLMGTGSIFTSLTLHLALLVGLGMWMLPEVVQIPVKTLEARVSPPEEDLLSIDLDEQVLPTSEMQVATLPQTPQVGVAEGSGLVGGGPSGTGGGTVSAPKFDPSVAERVEASEIRLDPLLSDAPPPVHWWAAAPMARASATLGRLWTTTIKRWTRLRRQNPLVHG